jgi:hypothetical protein
MLAQGPTGTLSREDERSWRLNEAALEAAAGDWPRAEALIRRNLARLAAEGRASPALIRSYAALVDEGLDALREGLLARTGRGQALRSLHPLAGLIDPRRRHELLRATRLR